MAALGHERGFRLSTAMGRFDPFAAPSGNGRYLRTAAALSGLDKETLRVLRQPKGPRLTSSDLRPFEARIATTREGPTAPCTSHVCPT
jgi:hypothetical protein